MCDVKTAANGTNLDMEVITSVEMIMMVRRVAICATRARVKVDASDRKQGGRG